MTTKSVFVTLAGHTNAGKSSLLNAIIGEKIASVSPKPQTTRTRITGIKTIGETQMVFMDTPIINITASAKRLAHGDYQTPFEGSAMP